MKLQLKETELFRHWETQYLSFIIENSQIRKYEPGQNIYDESDISGHLYLVLKGEVEILMYFEDGNQRILKKLKQNDFFGEIGFFDRKERENSAVAKVPSEILLISRNTFFSISEKLNYEAWLDMLKILASRLRNQTSASVSFNTGSPKAIIYSKLLAISKRNKSVIHMTQAELGKELGMSRSTAIRILQDLHGSGAVKKGNKMIIIDEKKLEETIRRLG